jgi:hypothetical protein
VCAWIWFSEIKYSQLKINHLNDTPSTKAAGGGIYSGVLLKDVKVPVKVRRTLSSLVPLLSTAGTLFYKEVAMRFLGCQEHHCIRGGGGKEQTMTRDKRMGRGQDGQCQTPRETIAMAVERRRSSRRGGGGGVRKGS